MARENKPRDPATFNTQATQPTYRVRPANSGPQPASTSTQIAAMGDSAHNTPANIANQAGGHSIENDEGTRIEQLQRELFAVRGDLHASLERFNASNEEFNAANEEVRSANEELQSTNEELKTSQEELRLVNAKLKGLNNQLAAKVKELETQHADLKNLVAATEVATVCLDRDLRIRWFTPAAARVIRLNEPNSGRPISDFSHDFAQDDLLEISRKVLRTLRPIEDEVGTVDDRTFLRRVLPYLTADHYIGGVIITFVAITERKKSEIALAASEKRLRELAKSLEHQVEHRISALKVLHDITMAANEALTFDGAVKAALKRICSYNGWVLGHAWRLSDENDFVSTKVWECARDSGNSATDFEPLRLATESARVPLNDPFVGEVIRTGRPKLVSELDSAESLLSAHAGTNGLRSAIAFPVIHKGQIVAVLEFFSRETIDGDERFMEIVPQVGIQLGHVYQRNRLEREVAVVADREQQRIGQDMHDGLSQQIAGIAMLAGTLADQLNADRSPLAKRSGNLVEAIEDAKKQARDLSKGLMPIEIDSQGLRIALDELAERTGKTYDIQCTFENPTALPETDSFTATHLYRIAREAVHNAVKHARAKRIWICLTNGVYTMLTVRDDGTGMDPAQSSDGEGLRIMRHRANLIGASLSLQNAEDGGTVVQCVLDH